MNKYVVMTGRDDVVVLNADDNKSVKAYIAKGYGITNRIKAKHPLEMSVVKIVGANYIKIKYFLKKIKFS